MIGGARLPNEDAYAWAKAARVALETDNVDAQLGDGLPAATVLGLPRATIDQAAAAPLVLTLAADIKDDVPVLYLRLRDAVRERGTPIVELTPAPTGLSPYAAETVIYRPGEIAALAAAVAGSAPVAGEVAGVPAGTIEAVRAHIARAREKTSPGEPARRRDPGPPVAGRAGGAGGGRSPATGHRARCGLPVRLAAGQRARGPRHGTGPRPAAGPGRARRRPGLVRAPLGRPVARTGPGWPRPGSWRRPAGATSAAWCCSAPTPAAISLMPSWRSKPCSAPASWSPSTPT